MKDKESKIKHLSKVEHKLSFLSDNDSDIFELGQLLQNEILNESKSDDPYNFYISGLKIVKTKTYKKLNSSKKKNRKNELKACVEDFKKYIKRYNNHINQHNNSSLNNGEPIE
ncbi:hypothetical protein BWZ22_13405 [Seonamhaeicola sp. S2-3]|uniref:hypothetical protein n=1 Tax=Seonamhaeicola sp. S2-3 TaxID=1936081 RepID=UPI000972D72F|nr:hypothetical protein [Seonamhaeicola sp. S2-3]APY12158.1 hypothetical protein BWZ22_13405 [Seonamhaeicola sp. S2-3]